LITKLGPALILHNKTRHRMTYIAYIVTFSFLIT